MNISEQRLHQIAEVEPDIEFEFDTSGAVDVAEIKVFTDISEASADWTEFEQTSVHTVFQSYEWLSAWQKHIGSKTGIKPQIIIGYGEDGTIRFLLPLAIKSIGPLRILSFLGCEEASYQIGQFAPRFARSLTSERVIELLQQIKPLLSTFHVARFKRQPYEWQGIKNPFADFDHKTAPSNGYAITLKADYQTLYSATRSWKSQSKISRRERKLATHGDIEFKHCQSEQEISRVLDIMFDQKEKRFCEQGIENFLDRPGVKDFYRTLCQESTNDGTHTLGLHYYKCGDQVLAVILGASYRSTEFGLINSMSDGPLRNFSPGLHLLHRDIERLCHDGTEVYDLGVGAHSYKDLWTDKEYPLFDSIIPTSAMGHIYAYASGFLLETKRYIKNSKILWPTFIRCRAKISSLGKSENCSPVNETF